MTIESEPERKKKGPWRDEAGDFREFKDAIRDVLRSEPRDSVWNVEIEVRKSGNPIHQYRIVLAPAT
jgi:hypothetical protein